MNLSIGNTTDEYLRSILIDFDQFDSLSKGLRLTDLELKPHQ